MCNDCMQRIRITAKSHAKACASVILLLTLDGCNLDSGQ